jgi:cutinase
VRARVALVDRLVVIVISSGRAIRRRRWRLMAVPSVRLMAEQAECRKTASFSERDGCWRADTRQIDRRPVARLTNFEICQDRGMGTGGRIFGVAVVVALAMSSTAIATPSAAAEPCNDIEVVFARGTGEPPGLGIVGQAFVDALGTQVGDRTVGVYPVDYPASVEYLASASSGAGDAGAHVQQVAASCPATKMVLGGYSQGASVVDFSTEQMPAPVANHVAAVAVFGNPSSTYATKLSGGALPSIAPLYRPKTIDLCVQDDPICSEGQNMAAHLLYVETGMVGQAATFAASRL